MEWVQCSIRLPDKDGRYIVTFDDATVDIGDYSIENGWYWTDDGVVCHSLADIIAWMPLPEAFKADKERKRA